MKGKSLAERASTACVPAGPPYACTWTIGHRDTLSCSFISGKVAIFSYCFTLFPLCVVDVVEFPAPAVLPCVRDVSVDTNLVVFPVVWRRVWETLAGPEKLLNEPGVENALMTSHPPNRSISCAVAVCVCSPRLLNVSVGSHFEGSASCACLEAAEALRLLWSRSPVFRRGEWKKDGKVGQRVGR